MQALRFGRFHPRTTLYGIFYFAEAVVAGRRIERRGIRHVHTHYATNIAWMMSRVFPVEVSMSIHGSGEFDDPKGFWLTEKDRVVAIHSGYQFFWTQPDHASLPGFAVEQD